MSTLGKKKGHTTPSSLPFLPPPSISIPLFLPLFLLLRPFARPLVTHRSTDHKRDPTADTNRAVPSRPLLSPGGRADVFLTPTVFLFLQQCCCFFYNMGWGFNGFTCFFYLYKGRGVCESCFPSFRHNKAHPSMASPVPLLSLTPSSPLYSLFVYVCVHCVNHCPC